MARNNRQIIPESRQAIQQWKYEIAAEFGLPVGYGAGSVGSDTEFAGELGSIGSGGSYTSNWGHLTSRENGFVGGEITKRLVAEAQRHLLK
ncbi:Small, acid-soluble spore protein 2 [compost metagenome]